jgi:hypothetical protein
LETTSVALALVKTFQEIESGSSDHREVFWKAVEAAARLAGCLG